MRYLRLLSIILISSSLLSFIYHSSQSQQSCDLDDISLPSTNSPTHPLFTLSIRFSSLLSKDPLLVSEARYLDGETSLKADYPFRFYPKDRLETPPPLNHNHPNPDANSANPNPNSQQEDTPLESYLGPLFHRLESTLLSLPPHLLNLIATHEASLSTLDNSTLRYVVHLPTLLNPVLTPLFGSSCRQHNHILTRFLPPLLPRRWLTRIQKRNLDRALDVYESVLDDNEERLREVVKHIDGLLCGVRMAEDWVGGMISVAPPPPDSLSQSQSRQSGNNNNRGGGRDEDEEEEEEEEEEGKETTYQSCLSNYHMRNNKISNQHIFLYRDTPIRWSSLKLRTQRKIQRRARFLPSSYASSLRPFGQPTRFLLAYHLIMEVLEDTSSLDLSGKKVLRGWEKYRWDVWGKEVRETWMRVTFIKDLVMGMVRDVEDMKGFVGKVREGRVNG